MPAETLIVVNNVRGLVPGGRVTRCNDWVSMCRQIAYETHHVGRDEDQRLLEDLSTTSIGLCKLTGKPCEQLALLIAAEIPLE